MLLASLQSIRYATFLSAICNGVAPKMGLVWYGVAPH